MVIKVERHNLLLSYTGTISSSIREEVFSKVYSYIIGKQKSIVTDEATFYELLILKKDSPKSILLEYTNRQGWLYNAIPIRCYAEILFIQNKSNVDIEINMYKKIEHQTVSLFNFELIDSNKANITWIDFVIEIFTISNIDDLGNKINELLNKELLTKRNEIKLTHKKKTMIQMKNILTFIFLLLLLMYAIYRLK